MAGRRIDDHSAWMGSSSKGSPLPDGGHKLKSIPDVEGTGGIKDYPDTAEHIERDQKKGISEVHKQPMKSGYRY